MYQRRLVDDELDLLLPHLAAIALDGPKGVGKTLTCRQRAATIINLDDPATREVVTADPRAILRGAPPVLIDEWQQVVATWDVVRRAVDDGAAPGSFLLTGSVTPLVDAPAHSGAGRIASLRMRPMSLSERNLQRPTVSLSALLAGGAVIEGDSGLTLSDYTHEIVASGFPGIRGLPARVARVQLDSYLTRAFSRSLSDEVGTTSPSPDGLRSWATAYAAATGTTASWESIRDAASSGSSEPPAKTTAIRYREWLSALWLLDPLPAWRPPGSPLQRLTIGPKHHLADPALAARLLKVGAEDLMAGRALPFGGHGALLGALFESLATLSVRTLSQAAEAEASHLRTQRGEHEIDLIVQGDGRRLVAMEVKLASSVADADVSHLHWFKRELGDAVSDLVVLTTGPTAYRRRDGIAVVPLALLGP